MYWLTFIFILISRTFANNGTNSSIDCQSDQAQNCAHCQTYGPCLNSIDPHCITHDALDCLPCETYAVCSSILYTKYVIIFINTQPCAACAPGWDPGCVSVEYHDDETCSEASLIAPNNKTIGISYLADGECNHHPVCIIQINSTFPLRLICLFNITLKLRSNICSTKHNRSGIHFYNLIAKQVNIKLTVIQHVVIVLILVQLIHTGHGMLMYQMLQILFVQIHQIAQIVK